MENEYPEKNMNGFPNWFLRQDKLKFEFHEIVGDLHVDSCALRVGESVFRSRCRSSQALVSQCAYHVM